jgi:type I restriction enzyme S subunit
MTTLNQLTHALLLNDGDWILSENMNPQGEVKLIQLGSVGMMRYVDKGFKYLAENTFQELNCTQIYSGYMLINRIVSDKMCSCILPSIEGKLITTVDTCWVAPKEEWYNLKYLMYTLSSPTFQSLVMLNSAGTTRKRISKNNLINLPFAVPPLEEQYRIVEAIDNAFNQLDTIAESLN